MDSSTIDYATLQKETLNQLRGALSVLDVPEKDYLLNLVDTAIDYGFYLVDDEGINK